jgi:hypothetical protein
MNERPPFPCVACGRPLHLVERPSSSDGTCLKWVCLNDECING